MMITKKVKRRK